MSVCESECGCGAPVCAQATEDEEGSEVVVNSDEGALVLVVVVEEANVAPREGALPLPLALAWVWPFMFAVAVADECECEMRSWRRDVGSEGVAGGYMQSALCALRSVLCALCSVLCTLE